MPTQPGPLRFDAANERTPATILEGLILGIFQGITAWMAYALVECLLSIFVPYFTEPNYNFMPVHWVFMAILFLCYLGAGAILGGLSGAFLFILRRRGFLPDLMSARYWFDTAAGCSVIIFLVLVTFAEVPIWRFYLWLMCALAFLAMILFVINGVTAGRQRLIRLLANPWVLYAMLLGLPWINERLLRDRANGAKGLTFAAYCVALTVASISISYAAEKLRKKRVACDSGSGVKYVWVSIALVVAAYGTACALDRWPIRNERLAGAANANVWRPNIILITMDAVRADHTSVYGYVKDTTPVLRALAKTATTYALPIAPGNMTLTSHASIFTGLYASRNGAAPSFPDYPAGRAMNGGVKTLAELLSEDGYATFGIVANDGYLKNVFGFDRGFDYYDERPRRRILAGGIQRFCFNAFVRRAMVLTPYLQKRDVEYKRAEEINREAFKLLESAGLRKRPFFLFLNYMDAHYPYVPPPPYNHLFNPGSAEAVYPAQFYKMKDDILSGKRNITADEKRYLESQYDGGIAYIDFCIDRLIQRLRELHLYDNSILIITSDHGETFGNRSMIEHACSLYQEEIFVPLIAVNLKDNAGETVGGAVSLIDLMPTILEAANAGERIPGYVEGRSLLGRPAESVRTVISESFPMGWKRKYPGINELERAAVMGGYKLIERSGRQEVFDLASDPDETSNIAARATDVVALMQARMKEFLAIKAPRQIPGKGPDKATMDRLKALGYVK